MDMVCQFDDIEGLKAKLRHVLWIGGPTDSGKTKTATRLAEKHGLQVYHGDKQWPQRWERITPDKQPGMCRFADMSMDERWVIRTVEELTQYTLDNMREELPLFFDALLELDADCPIVAEWFGLLPACIAPVLSSVDQAVWLVGTEAFRMASIAKRGKADFHRDTSDPAKAWENHYGRDVRLVEIIRQQAEDLGLRVIMNNGERSVEETVGQVEAHFGKLLG